MSRRLPARHLALALSMFIAAADAAGDGPPVRVTDAVLFGDMECFKVETPTATYLYGKRGAGFASIVDPMGRDWVSYRHGGKSSGEYRGLPKCGQPVKYFHCGYGFGRYATDNVFTSTVTLREAGHVRIHSVTKNADAACEWDFFPTHATMTLREIPGRYWFVYEGTPGGALDAAEDFVLRPQGHRTALTQPWVESIPWVVFGAKESPHGLFLASHQTDAAPASYVSWPYAPSRDEGLALMTVFGFGRPPWDDANQHTPPLSRLPARYTIAITPEATTEAAEKALRRSRETEPALNAGAKLESPSTGSAISSTPGNAADLPKGFVEETLLTGINAGTAIAVMPDGRVLVAEQTGKVLVIKDGKRLPAPLLDLTERVDSYWERGLVGLTVHPDFPRTPHLFVLYVAAKPFPHHVLSRFVVVGDRAQVESEHILLEGDDQSKREGKVPAGHQGGPIRFGPDGCIYVCIGEPIVPRDGDCTAQQLHTLSGKILRLRADGSIPEDNPFFTPAAGKYRSIWAIGLRNPFGLAFQKETGRLFATDVGQTSFEEVNEIVRGGDYGWPEAEGMSTNAAFKNPLHAYPPVVGRSIVGAAFSPREGSGEWPAEWRGKFFFADWAAHWVKALDPDAPEKVLTFAKNLRSPAAIEFMADGSLLVLNRGTIWRDGKKFVPDSGSLVRIHHSKTIGKPSAPAMPRTLAEAGVFKSLTPLAIDDRFVPVEIIAAPWQPGVRVRRWISVPTGARMKVNAEQQFEYPAGTIVVQHHTLEKSGAAFETHVFWLTEPRVARAAAYRWDRDGTAATLIENSDMQPLPDDPKRYWLSPGAEKQLPLDQVIVGFVLPLTPAQLNQHEQLDQWVARGWLDAVPSQLPKLAALDDAAAPLDLRVRSYLEVNCAICHRPGGPSRGFFDARIGTPLAEQQLIDGTLMAGDLGIPGARVIVPGSIEQSVLYQRIARDDAFRMPQINLNHEPQPVLPVLAEWIRSLPPAR